MKKKVRNLDKKINFKSKKFWAIPIACIVLFAIVALILCLTIKSEYIDRISLWISTVVGIFSLLASVLAIGLNVKFELRNEENRKKDIENRAIEFINTNSDEIDFLPFSHAAYIYDKKRHYNRSIYNKYIVLPKEVKESILSQLNYKDSYIVENNWVYKAIEMVRKYIKDNDLGMDVLYEGAKYFFKNIECDYRNLSDKHFEYKEILPDEFKINLQYSFFNRNNKFLTFKTYCEFYLKNRKENSDLFRELKKNKPIDFLSNIIRWRHIKESEACYWVMIIIDTICWFIINEEKYEKLEELESEILSNTDSNKIETIEDHFLYTLSRLYKLYILRN